MNKGRKRKDGTNVKTRYYACSGYVNKGKSVCQRRVVGKEWLEGWVEKRIEKSQNKLELLTRALTGLGPENVLRRGYSYVASGKSIITSQKEFDKLSKETELRIHFYDGKGLVRKS